MLADFEEFWETDGDEAYICPDVKKQELTEWDYI